jgi:glycine dehydrogenase subunit 1
MRYLPLTDADRKSMLATIGVAGIDDLYINVPASARLDTPVPLPRHQGEMEVERALSAMAEKNLHAAREPFFLGCGAYRHHIPATVDHLIQRGEFLTSYTPYQPEITQGTLQMLFEFQTMVAMLTGMEVANASMYDGASGTAEAVLMANRVSRRHRAVLSGGLHPHYRETVET